MSARGPQKIRTNTQVEILYKLATEGSNSISKLSKKPLNKYRTNFVKATQILKKLEMVVSVDNISGPKGMEVPYKITDKGIEMLSTNNKITLEQFWKIIFLMFDGNIGSTKYPTEQFFINYEKNVLGYDLDYVSIKPNVGVRNFGISYPKPQELTVGIEMLIALLINKSMTKENLMKYIKNKNTMKIKIVENELGPYFKRLVQDKLVVNISNDENSKYRTTIQGFLIIMEFLSSSIEIWNRKDIDFKSITRKIIKNSQINLPFISCSWDKLRDIVDESNAVRLFNGIMDESDTISGSIQIGGVKELLVIERMMSEAYQKIINKEYMVGLEIRSDLVKKGKIEDGFSSFVRKRLLFLGILDGFYGKNQDHVIKLVKGEMASLDNLVEKSISNKVSFEFFTYFIDWVIREKSIINKNEKLDRLDKFHFSFVKKWNNFQNNNKEFREWYASWIKQLLKFEEKNIKIFSKTNFLDV